MSSQPAFAIVTAAGSGTRLGYDMPKALVTLDGLTLVERAVAGIAQLPTVAGIVVTAPATHLVHFEVLFLDTPNVVVVSGGDTRQASVFAGLNALDGLSERLGVSLEATSPILIHDAARCLTPPSVVQSVLTALERGHDAVIPGLPVTDTQKIVEATVEPDGSAEPDGAVGSDRSAGQDLALEAERGSSSDATRGSSIYVTRGLGIEDERGLALEKVVGQVDRTPLRAVQTPQGFHWQTIMRAHQEGLETSQRDGREATDDATLVEWMGKDVYVVPGSQLSMKITTKTDLVFAQALLNARDTQM